MSDVRSQYLALQQRLIEDLPDETIVELAPIDVLASASIYDSLVKHHVPGLIVLSWRWSDGDIIRSYILPNDDRSVKSLLINELSINNSAHWCAYSVLVRGVTDQHTAYVKLKAAQPKARP